MCLSAKKGIPTGESPTPPSPVDSGGPAVDSEGYWHLFSFSVDSENEVAASVDSGDCSVCSAVPVDSGIDCSFCSVVSVDSGIDGTLFSGVLVDSSTWRDC